MGLVMGVGAYVYQRRNLVPEPVEEAAQLAMQAAECDEEEQRQGPIGHSPRRWRRITLVGKVVRALKIRFQVIANPQEVDRIAVRRYAYDYMESLTDISDADKLRVAPIAAALYWAKSDSEIIAAMVGGSNVVSGSNARYTRGYYGSIMQRVQSWFTPASAGL